MPKPRIDDDYYPPIKKPTPKPTAPKPTAPKPAAPKTAVNYYNWEERSYWQKKQQAEYIKQMEAELMRQWAQSEVSIAQQTFTDMPSQVGKYTYKQPFQYQINESPLIRQLMAANPRSVVLEGLMRTGYSIPNPTAGNKIPNWSAPQKQVPQTFPLGSWAQNPDQYFGSGVNMGPQKPANMEYEAYVPIGYGGYSYGGGWGGGGGSYDYTSNPFYRGAETTRKPSYYETYLTWRVK